MIPKRFAPALFAIILSGNMSLLISGISTYSAIGPIHDFAGLWMSSWLMAWGLAFPVVLIVAPLARRLVGLLVEKD